MDRRWQREVLLFVCAWFAAGGLAAQITPTGSEVGVGTTATFQAALAVSSDPQGDFVVAWQKQNGSGGWDVFFRQFTVSGTPVAAEIQANLTSDAHCRQFPAVASDGAGNFVVAWQSDQAGALGIFARLFGSAGLPLTSEFQVSATSPAGNRQFPAAAMAPDGRFLIVWQSAPGEDGSSWGVFGQAYAKGGGASGGQFLVNQTTAGAQHSPAVAFLASAVAPDGFGVTWQSEGQDGAGAGTSGVYVRSFDGSGNALSSETPVNLTVSGAQGHARMASDFSGNFVVVWESLSAAGSEVLARRFSHLLAPLSGELAVDQATLGSQRNPAVTSDGLGNFVVTWDSLGQDGSGTAVLAQEFGNQQRPPLPPQALGGKAQLNLTTAGDQSFAVPAASAGGSFWMVWQSQTPAADGSVIVARTASVPALNFYTLSSPCRMFDTRGPNGLLGGPSMVGGQARNFPVATSTCGIPAAAKALSINVTMTGATANGHIVVYPGDAPQPGASTLNFSVGQTRANNAVIVLSLNGDGSLNVSASLGGPTTQVDVFVDVNGYFQ